MYEAVNAHPDGRSTAARLADTAAGYGFDGIVVRNGPAALSAGDCAAIREHAGIDVVIGSEVRTDAVDRARGRVGSRRREATVVLVAGGTAELNRYAVETDAVDVLARPTAAGADPDHVMVRQARESGVRLEFDLGPIIHETGGTRVRAIQRLRSLAELVDHYDAPYVVSARPSSHLELRPPRELAALGAVIGVGEDWIERGLAEWTRLTARNRRIAEDTFIEPGVELEDDP